MELASPETVAEFAEHIGCIPQQWGSVDHAECVEVCARAALTGKAGVREHAPDLRMSLDKKIECAVPVGGVQDLPFGVRFAEAVHETQDALHEITAHATEMAANHPPLPLRQGASCEFGILRLQIPQVDHIPRLRLHRRERRADRLFSGAAEKHIVLQNQQRLCPCRQSLPDRLSVAEQRTVRAGFPRCSRSGAQRAEELCVGRQTCHSQCREFAFDRFATVESLGQVDDPHLIEEFEDPLQCVPAAATASCASTLPAGPVPVKASWLTCA